MNFLPNLDLKGYTALIPLFREHFKKPKIFYMPTYSIVYGLCSMFCYSSGILETMPEYLNALIMISMSILLIDLTFL